MSQKLIDLKNRISSVDNIKGTAKTMATVAAAKFARTANKAARLEAYSNIIQGIVESQSKFVSDYSGELQERYPLLAEKKNADQVVLLVVASDIGMCGNYNSQINKVAEQFIEDKEKEDIEVVLVTKGIKAEEYFEKRTSYKVSLKFTWNPEGVSIKEAENLLTYIQSLFDREEIKSVYVAYTQFYSASKMEPQIIKLLPISSDMFTSEGLEGSSAVDESTTAIPFENRDWIYEPSVISILDELIPSYLRVKVYDILLQAYASEQSSRMMAMEQATDRAEATLKELRVNLNKMRRDLVTLDLLGILSAARIVEKESMASSGF